VAKAYIALLSPHDELVTIASIVSGAPAAYAASCSLVLPILFLIGMFFISGYGFVGSLARILVLPHNICVTGTLSLRMLYCVLYIAGALSLRLLYAIASTIATDVIDFPSILIRYLRHGDHRFDHHTDIDYCYMMDGDSDLSDYDGRKYPACKPYYGGKGQTWNTFVRDFGSAMAL
jgi:hypothetical protein